MKFVSILFLFISLVHINPSTAEVRQLQSIDQVISKFQNLTLKFKRDKNHRLIFATTYLDSTIEIKKEIENNSFIYPNWVESIVVDFANLYISALHNYDQSKETPLSWKEAFKINDQKYYKLSVQLLMAMNAHIYHDLPIALIQSFDKGFQPEEVKNDFYKMNEAFERLTPKFMALLYDLEKTLGINKKGIKDWIVFNVVKSMRSDAWDLGLKLYQSSSANRFNLINHLGRDAFDNANLIRKGRFFIPSH